MKHRTFRIDEFLSAIRSTKRDFHIRRLKRSNDRSRRRISILVVDEFLRARDDIHQAFFLEGNLYHNLKTHHLSCDPTPDETRLQQLRRKKGTRIGGFNPLKLVSENIEPEDYETYPFTEAIIKILTEDKENQDGISTNSKGGATPGTSEHLQEDPRFFEEQKKLSFY